MTTPTDLHHFDKNEFTRHFDGRVNIAAGAALYYYVSGGITASMIELIKYRDRKDLAYQLGLNYGLQLKDSIHFHDCELVVPVPLHPLRLKERGYNQSEFFAKGLSESMGINLQAQNMIRTSHTHSQTSKDRQQRIQNIQGVFQLVNPQVFNKRHILLVDDVLTTGATLESCALEIQKAEPASIRMATIAMGY